MEIIKIYGNENTLIKECFNPIQQTFAVRFDKQKENDTVYSYQQILYPYKPSFEAIKEAILGYFNGLCDTQIYSGYTYNGYTVWLSQENQMNYKTNYDLALQTSIAGGEFEVIKIKIGDNLESIYHTFESFKEYQDFVIGYINHIKISLDKFWTIKDSIEWDDYKH